jgi:hypothetical protein
VTWSVTLDEFVGPHVCDTEADRGDDVLGSDEGHERGWRVHLRYLAAGGAAGQVRVHPPAAQVRPLGPVADHGDQYPTRHVHANGLADGLRVTERAGEVSSRYPRPEQQPARGRGDPRVGGNIRECRGQFQVRGREPHPGREVFDGPDPSRLVDRRYRPVRGGGEPLQDEPLVTVAVAVAVVDEERAVPVATGDRHRRAVHDPQFRFAGPPPSGEPHRVPGQPPIRERFRGADRVLVVHVPLVAGRHHVHGGRQGSGHQDRPHPVPAVRDQVGQPYAQRGGQITDGNGRAAHKSEHRNIMAHRAA